MSTRTQTKNKRGIIVGLTGGIAAYKACDVVSSLVRQDYAVTCVMTKNATEFITPLTLQTLTHERVFVDQFEYDPSMGPPHISLSDYARLVVIMPATADFLAKMRVGLADDLLSSLVLSADCPIIVVPAMNTRMWEHPATQENISILKERGIRCVDPMVGRLSCGTVGKGHIAATEEVMNHITAVLKKRK